MAELNALTQKLMYAKLFSLLVERGRKIRTQRVPGDRSTTEEVVDENIPTGNPVPIRGSTDHEVVSVDGDDAGK